MSLEVPENITQEKYIQSKSCNGDANPRNSDENQEVIQEKIKEIESLNIGPVQQAELILVLLGAKKATNLSLYQWNDTPEKIKATLVDKCQIYLAEIKGEKNNAKVLAEYAAALDKETAERLANLDPSKDHKEFGELMSFQQSAIEAFDTPKVLERENYPNMSGIIFHFSLSKDNWQEEMKVLKNWSELIRTYSPRLYEELQGNQE